jgi:heptosyltransferase-2
VVRAPNWLGDAVLALPLLRAFADERAGADLHLVAHERVTALYRREAPGWTVLAPRDLGRGFADRVAALAKQDFDEARLLTPSVGSALLAWAAGIPRRRGIRAEGRGVLLTEALPADDRSQALWRRYAEVLETPGAALHPGGVRTPLTDGGWLSSSPEGRKEAEHLLGEASWSGEPLVALFPGASYGPAKAWPAVRWGELVAECLDGRRAVVLGGPGDAAAAAAVLAAARDTRPIDLAGRTSLEGLIAVLEHVEAAVGNDSGGLHVAAAAGVPSVVLFGSTDPGWTAPPVSGADVVRAELECSPCFRRACPHGSYACLYGISARQVRSALRRVAPADGTLPAPHAAASV